MPYGRPITSAALAQAVARHDRGPGPVQRCDRMAWRADASRKIVHPNGMVDVPGVACRTGVQVYDEQGPDGRPVVTRELRPPSEVFDPASLATLNGSPVTIEHPGQGPDHDAGLGEVTTANARELTHGWVLSVEPHEADGLVWVWLRLASEDVLAAVSGGKVELSCGYTATLADPADPQWAALVALIGPEPGLAANGDRYDLIQTSIRYNHLAIVDAARAGPIARLHLDSKGRSMKTKITIKRDGKTTTGELPTWIVDAAAKHAVDRKDADGVLGVAIEGKPEMMLPEEMVNTMLAAIGMGGSGGPSAPEPQITPDADPMAEPPAMVADADEEEPAAMRADAIRKLVQAEIKAALPTVQAQVRDSVTASARERQAVERLALPVLGHRFDYAAHDLHGIAVEVIKVDGSPKLEQAKALAERARKGDQAAGGRLAQLMEDALDRRRDAEDTSGALGAAMFDVAASLRQDAEEPGESLDDLRARKRDTATRAKPKNAA